MQGHIVVVGSINMDLVVRAPRHPIPGETILGSSFRTFPGGKGANQAVAAARLGGQVMMVGRVGDDSFGSELLSTLNRDGVDTRHVLRTPEIASGVALITVSDSGQNNIVVVPGSNGKLTPDDIHSAETAFIGASVVLLQLETPLDTVAEAVCASRKHGARVVLNPAPAAALPESLLSQVDILIPNESELALLTGVKEIPAAAAVLKTMGVGQLIVTLGAEGVLVLDDQGTVQLPSYKVRVVDTTAAGDAFVGAFAVAITHGKSLRQAAAIGNAAGALAVTLAGAQPSLPDQTALEAFLAENIGVE